MASWTNSYNGFFVVVVGLDYGFCSIGFVLTYGEVTFIGVYYGFEGCYFLGVVMAGVEGN